MSIKNETFRIFLRKDTAVFRVNFFSDVAQTIPIIPVNIAQYPAYTIYDIANTVIQSGVGQPEASPGRYKVEFIIPADAPLSFDQKRWRIEWTIVSTDSRQVDFVEEFDIKDPVITASETREQKFITLGGQDTRVMLRQSRRPSDIALDVFRSTSTSDTIVNNISMGSGLIEAVDGDSLVYYYDIPGVDIGSGCQTFSIIWKVRNSVGEPQQFIYQILTAVTPQVLMEVTSVRMLIDKLQKRLGTVQAYEDSDIVEYLARATDLLNAGYPTTFFQLGVLPSVLTTFHVLLAAWYGLQAQFILETELSFSFGGQTVTLDYDHASNLADVAGRWNEFIEKNLPAAKMALVRRGSSVGAVAGRGYRYTSSNLVFKIASGQGANNLVNTLSHFGLLF